ncbi:PAS domain S-box protein [Hydrogenophaga sp.]|uniref:two-component system sensor histidine kinase NtrB n=1 Tax=Hydrogenophaga sp. TaxID=1904254 RepID=UPI0025BA1809|nr:PAS domain S-box protein [Hydrogenophaga sp.]
MKSQAATSAGRWSEVLHSRRGWLWGALLLLVSVLLSVLVFLAGEFEEARDQAALERDAASLVSDIRSELVRNVQTLQALHSVAPSAERWAAPADHLLIEHREIVRVEWRSNSYRLLAQRDTPYLASLVGHIERDAFLPEVRQACDNAVRLSGPAFSASYFWPLSEGRGLELMEMCLPLVRAGLPDGFLVATHGLQGVLTEFTDKDLVRGRGLSFNEADGTRLAILSQAPESVRSLNAQALLDLPGHTLNLRLEAPLLPLGLFPNVLTAVVGVLSLALLVVLALLGRDMRLRQRAELEVAEALAFRKAMENSLVTGLRARDMDGRITYVNPAFCQMVGYSAEELLGAGLPAPWWPPERVDEYQHRRSLRLSGQNLPREGYESVFQRRDGTRFPVLIIEAPLIDAQGQQTGHMSAMLDITEQRRIEDLNRASQDRLQATARLTTVGEMASLLSHELNQPLAAIASYATGTLNLLEDGNNRGTPDELRQAMRRIGEQADRAGRVIKSVADFVRRREQTREAVAPLDLVDAIAPLLSLQAKKLGIRLQIDFAPALPPVWCDRTLIEQVLLNLARNGMQAMPEGHPTLVSGLRVLRLAATQPRLSARGVGGSLSHKAWVEFSVTDHGEGLSDAVASQLFTPFFTTKAEGMGLGLSLCRTVVEQHGGALSFDPALPRGTVFRFTLPADVGPPVH